MTLKKHLHSFLLIILTGLFLSGKHEVIDGPSSPLACTSFAVYNGNPLYGMNFDYPEVPLRFTIRDFGELAVFQLEFKDEGGFIPTVGMNNFGLFSSSQMLFPEMPSTPGESGSSMTIWQLYQAGLYRHHSVNEVLSLVDEYQIVNSGLTLHALFADPSGEAIVVEVIDDQEQLTSITGDFLVMTNFPISSIQGQPLGEINGVGADRYQIATQAIRDNQDGFQVDAGFLTLEAAALVGEYSTQASMVFDPIDLQIYIALDRDFEHIWRVSLQDKTIEAFRGFPSRQTIALNHQGITEEEMAEMGFSGGRENQLILDLLLPISILSVLGLIIWSYTRISANRNGDRSGKP